MSRTPRTTVASIIEQDGRFLMVEEWTDNEQIVFNQPAGHLEENESILNAVIRETREETAWGFSPRGLVGIYRWQVPPDGATYIRFCIHGNCMDHDPDQPLDDGIINAHWMSREDLLAQKKLLRSPMVIRCIDDYLQGISYPLEILNDLP